MKKEFTLEDVISFLLKNGHTTEELEKTCCKLEDDPKAWMKFYHLKVKKVVCQELTLEDIGIRALIKRLSSFKK